METTLQYFKQAEKILEANEFEDEEAHQLFIQNVFGEAEGLEYRLSCSHDGSVILEKMVRHGTGFHLRVFFEKIRERLLDMCCHRYASHVVETWLRMAVGKVAAPEEQEQEAEQLPKLPEQLRDLATMVREDPLRLVEDPYGSHVIRLLLRLWQGELDGSLIKVPDGREHFAAFVEALLTLPPEVFDVPRAIQNVQISAILQYIISCPGGYGPRLLNVLFPTALLVTAPDGGSVSTERDGTRFLRLADTEAGSRFFESLLASLDAPAFLLLFTRLIRGNVVKLLEGHHANFVLQCLISRCHNLSQFQMVVESLREFVPQLLDMRRHGILLRCAQWVVDHELMGAEEVMTLIFGAFHLKDASDRKQSFVAISRLQTKAHLDAAAPLSPAGCSLLQLLVHFPAAVAKPIIDGFMDYPVPALVSMSSHPQGSRIVEATLLSRHVSAAAKQRTIRRLRDHVDALATDKFGSHIVDRAWSLATGEMKERIVEQLLTAKAKLEDSPHGRLVLRNCRAHEFEKSVESWKQTEQSAERRKAMFAELLEDEGDTLLPAHLQITLGAGKEQHKKKERKKAKTAKHNSSWPK